MIEKIGRKVKNEKGIAGQDLIIAIFILMMFLTFLLTVYSNIKKLSYEMKMNAKASDIASTIAEHLKTLEYEDEYFNTDHEEISAEDLRNTFSITGLNMDIYQVNIRTTTMEYSDDTNIYDLTKEVVIQVKYNLKGDFENSDQTEIKLVKDREIVRLEDDIENIDSYKPVVAIDTNTKKELSNVLENVLDSRKNFVITSKDDSNWSNYSYFDGSICCVTATEESGEVTYSNVLAWVPRYAVENNTLIFLYKDTNYPIVPIYATGENGDKFITGYTVDRTKTFEPADGFLEGEKGKWAGISYGSTNYTLYNKMVNLLSSNSIYTGE